MTNPGTQPADTPVLQQPAQILAKLLRENIESITRIEDQVTWHQALTDPSRLKEQFDRIQALTAKSYQGAPEGISQEAITLLAIDLIKNPIPRMGSRTSASFLISAAMLHRVLEHLDVPAELFLPTRASFDQGYKGERTIGYGLPAGKTINLVTGYDETKNFSAAEILEAIGFEGAAQIQLNGINLEEHLPKAEATVPPRAEFKDIPALSGDKPFFLQIYVDTSEFSKETANRVKNLHQSFNNMEAKLQDEITELLTSASTSSEVTAAREYLAERMHSVLGHTPGTELQEDRRLALDIFARETILRKKIMGAFSSMLDEDAFADPLTARSKAAAHADKILSDLDPSLVEGAVRAFIEINTESITTQPSHSDAHRHAKAGISQFLSPMMARVFNVNPDLVVFELDFARYHSKPRVSMSGFGSGLETILDSTNKSGRHILIKGSDPTHIATAREIGKGVQFI